MKKAAAAAAFLLIAAPGAAQISPGELARAHAGLDGSDHCLECHSKDKGVDPDLCLACHRPLAERLAAGAGLHADPEHRDCRTCHIEHHGRGFELVWWGDGGPRSLDHRLTGYALEGRHASLGCRDCHRAELVVSPRPLLAAGKDLDRTFLGLGTECLSCHTDPHQGQLEGAGCRSCHTLEAWRPAALFDHGSTSFRLTGRHRDAACAKCHPFIRGSETVRYRGVRAAWCSDCHRDPHGGRLGLRCESCHGTASWRGRIDEASFDHEHTRYPLRGRHREVACVGCHRSGGRTQPIPGFERCSTCHADVHAGQFRDRPDRGACTSCHSVDGFRPARYGLEEHRGSRYPLAGSHLAVPCAACHSTIVPAELVRLEPALQGLDGVALDETRRFTFSSTACEDCHEDPHGGGLDRYREPSAKDPSGCVSCHDLTAWRSYSFDHGRAPFHLAGRHRSVACDACHRRDTDGRMRLGGVPATCAGCHRDRHAGQFDRGGRPAECESCHTLDDWKPSRFDHARAAYQLTGAHRRVPCAGCHPSEGAGEDERVRYRPLPTTCGGCHGASRTGGRP